MTEVALLNPQADAELSRRLLDAVGEAVQSKERVVLTSVLDREAYLQNMGALVALRELHREVETIYRRKLNI